MNTERIPDRCPKCQAILPPESPPGLCAACRLAERQTPAESQRWTRTRWVTPPLGTVVLAFPQLEVFQLVGCGGMGAVYKARQPKLDRFVALKILPQTLAGDTSFTDRFNREARLLARLNHPGIVSVYDFGEAGGFFYLLMEFVDGVNLRQAMKTGRCNPQQALYLVPRICDALQFAHDEGILHRDIKPENILLDSRGRVKIADFGIAKLVGEAGENLTLTSSGMVLGTPSYMAPEQLEHPQEVDQRADIYSLGVIFYEMLTGELPLGRFAAPSVKTPIDQRVDEIVFRALEKEPQKRFRTANEIKMEVERITTTPLAVERNAGAMEKTSMCFVSTPEYLRTFRGRLFRIYRGKGELKLSGTTLSFVSGWQVVTIPLDAITGLAQGEYPFSAKPGPLHYLAVTFREGGVARTLFFTPTPGSAAPGWEKNKKVSEWIGDLKAAVLAATGRNLNIESSSTPGWTLGFTFGVFVVLSLAFTLMTVPLIFIFEQRPPSHFGDLIRGPIAAIITMLLLLARWMWAALFSSRSLGRQRPSDTTAHSQAALATQAGSPAAVASRTDCYFSTPERLRNCYSGLRARVFLCKGELVLGQEELTFISSRQTTVGIPLKDILELGIGHFKMRIAPWVNRSLWFNFLFITFSATGGRRTVCLTPAPINAASLAMINAQVAGWFQGIRKVIEGVPGASPHIADTGSVTVRASAAWCRKRVVLVAVPLVAWLIGIANGRSSAGLIFFMALLLCLAVGWVVLGVFRTTDALESGDLDEVTGDEPPEPSLNSRFGTSVGKPARQRRLWWSVSAWIFLLIGIFSLVDTLASFYGRPMRPTFHLGMAHFLAGIALLTWSRRWRMAAIIALAAAMAAGAFVIIMMAVNPARASVAFPVLTLAFEPSTRPWRAAFVAVFACVVLCWPLHLLTCAKARRLFGLSNDRNNPENRPSFS